MGFKEFIRPNAWKIAFVVLSLTALILFFRTGPLYCSTLACTQPPQDYRFLSLLDKCPCTYVSLGQVLAEYAVWAIAAIILYSIASLIGAAISAIKSRARL